MLLVDRDIKQFLINGEIASDNQTSIKNGSIDSVTNIGYDLTCNVFHKSVGDHVEHCALLPGESVFVESKEILQFDKQTIGIVQLKNSRIRMGLSLDAPIYQPGHITPIIFRLTNLTNQEIELRQGDKCAMLLFAQLEHDPEHTYKGTFQEEFSFSGMGDYTAAYSQQIKDVEGKIKDLKSIEKTLYTNVITILTIFIGIFSLLNMNITLAKNAVSAIDYLTFNLAIIGALSFLSCLLHEVLQREKFRHWLWVLPAICFAALFALVLFV